MVLTVKMNLEMHQAILSESIRKALLAPSDGLARLGHSWLAVQPSLRAPFVLFLFDLL